MTADEFVLRIAENLDGSEELAADVYIKNSKDIIRKITKTNMYLEHWFLENGDDWNFTGKRYDHDDEDRYRYYESNEIDERQTLRRLFR